MQRSDFAYSDLSLDQYEAIINAAQIFKDASGTVIASPLHGAANHDSLIAACKADNIDPRLDLAVMLWEDHFGTDPGGGVALATVYNFSGVKWAGQSGAFDSGIAAPANEGGTYAGFHDFGSYALILHRTYNNTLIGPYFKSGDLVNAFSVYITGQPFTGRGQGRVDTFLQYQRQYPAVPAAPAGETLVYGSDLIAYVRTLIGQQYATVETDPVNGVHPWAFFCESLAERAPEHFGLTEIHRGTALEKGQAAQAQGLLQTSGEPEHGAWVIFGASFDAQGHIGFWDKEKGALLGTLTDGTGIGYHAPPWGMQTPGVMGWMRVVGVAGEYRPAAQPLQVQPATSDNWVPEGNPYNTGRTADHALGFGGAIATLVRADSDWLPTFGWPMTNEYDGLLCTPIGGGRYRILPCVCQDTERQRIVFAGGVARTPLRWEVCGPADDLAVVAVINAMKAAAQ